jgi:hypothetical protein
MDIPDLVERNRRIFSQYRLVDGIFKTLEHKIRVDVDRLRYPYACNAIYYYSKRLDLIIKPILETNEYYMSTVLMRSFIEHFLIGYYIVTRSLLEGRDTVGVEYYREFYNSEQIRRIYKKIHIEENIIRKSPKINALKEFNKATNKNYTQKELDDIHKVAGQFHENNIIKYLIHNTPTEDYFKDFNSSLAPMLDLYNYSSSYIHGGISAEEETYRSLEEERKNNRIEIHKAISCTSITVLKERLLEILHRNIPDYINVLVPIQQFFRQKD